MAKPNSPALSAPEPLREVAAALRALDGTLSARQWSAKCLIGAALDRNALASVRFIPFVTILRREQDRRERLFFGDPVTAAVDWLREHRGLCPVPVDWQLYSQPGEKFRRAVAIVADLLEADANNLAHDPCGVMRGAKVGNRRGRPRDSDPKADAQLDAVWQSGRYKTRKELADAQGMKLRDCIRALERVRDRKRRSAVK